MPLKMLSRAEFNILNLSIFEAKINEIFRSSTVINWNAMIGTFKYYVVFVDKILLLV